MDPRSIPSKMLGGYDHANQAATHSRIDITPLRAKLAETEALAKRYQTGTPAVINFAPLIAKIREAAAIGAALQAKARAGNL